MGLGVLLLPNYLGARLLSASAAPTAALFLIWLIVSYVATSLMAVLPVPALYEAIGVYIWRVSSEAMTQLALQLAVAASLGGLARSRLPLEIRC